MGSISRIRRTLSANYRRARGFYEPGSGMERQAKREQAARQARHDAEQAAAKERVAAEQAAARKQVAAAKRKAKKQEDVSGA